MKKLLCLIFSFLFFSPLMSNDLAWTSPETLSMPKVGASDPQIVMDLNGNSTAAWVEGGFVNASFQLVNGSWETPVVLSGMNASSPRLGVDASGNVTAAWIENGLVMSASMPFGGSWDLAKTLSGAGASAPVIAARSNGDVVAVWVRSGFIESSTKLFGGSWSLVSMISGANADNPDVAVGDNGTVVAIWHSNGTAHVIQSSSKMITGAWTTPKQLIQVSSAYNHNYPKVSVDPDGNADAIWYRYQVNDGNYINVVVFASSLPLNAAGWLPIPTYLTQPGLRNPADLKAKITHDSQGNALALWSISYDNSTFVLESALKLVGGVWSDVSRLVPSDLYSFSGDISATSIGGVVVGYMVSDGSDSLTIQAVETNISGISPGIFWSSPIQISTSSGNISPKVCARFIGDEVKAGAAWLSWDGSNSSLQVATGSRVTIAPPTDLTVSQGVEDFGVYQDYFNTISWQPSSDPNVIGYMVTRNGVLFSTVNSSVFETVEHNVLQNGPVVYGVAAIDGQLAQSKIVYINFP